MVVVLPGHEFIDELVGPLNDLINFLDLLLLYFFVAAIQDLLVLAVLLYWPPQSVSE